jgi:hypothetical protein
LSSDIVSARIKEQLLGKGECGTLQIVRALRETASPNTVIGRLRRMKRDGEVEYRRGKRRSKLWYLASDERLEKTNQYWMRQFEYLERLVELFAGMKRLEMPTTRKMLVAYTVTNREVSHALTRALFLEQESGLVESRPRAEALQGVMFDLYLDLLRRFLGSLRPLPTLKEYDDVIRTVDDAKAASMVDMLGSVGRLSPGFAALHRRFEESSGVPAERYRVYLVRAPGEIEAEFRRKAESAFAVA